ncbi:MAG: efflux RND transporter periplasmic adaptor subunit [Mesorhizobium sp.]|nr:MAG: efflux RND transporter periplasmic adaptor subunit [Mesorhizobium sp.]RWL88756.1 MAG: efflux RND transporter periplasmic adaptor subunit [Mesorhizobium sp.]RWM03369.1 MAG: efflux RND transporter periplasmic adaptor subunit [Mesorhizobium sp.]RWM04873.1 MAG: efflux RND transporter periplasmic adaptor subunit [Mesorhizobium sp.]TIP06013.1 MAG: efflux RND transporter periplasmic adaptor subunit [Mesorhizobium sp.]
MVRLISTLLVVLAAIGVFSGWYVWPADVDAYIAEQRLLAREIAGPGLLGATNQVVVTARVQAFLAEVNVDQNDEVKSGQVLATLNATDLQFQLAAAVANDRAAAEMVHESELERDRLAIAAATAKADLERRRTLLDRKSISQSDFDLAESTQKQAQAELARAVVTIERAKAQSAKASAEVEQLRSRVAETSIRSPVDGVVVSRSRTVGDLLSPGIELMQIVDPKSLLVFARFDESAMASLHPGQTAKVTFSSNPLRSYAASIVRIGRQVDQETREFTVDLRLDQVPSTWAVGQRANVVIQAQSPAPGIAIPQHFLARDQGRVGLWVARNGRAYWAPVALGYSSGTDIEITRGLDVGDVVLNPTGRFQYQAVSARATAQ